MIASMAGFAIEDAFLKTVTQQVPVGQVLMMCGVFGLCTFALMARRVDAPLFHPQVFTRRMLYRAFFEFFEPHRTHRRLTTKRAKNTKYFGLIGLRRLRHGSWNHIEI